VPMPAPEQRRLPGAARGSLKGTSPKRDPRELRRQLAAMVKRGRSRYVTFRALADRTGVSAATLQRIAKGKLAPSVYVVDQIAASLGEEFWLGTPPE
jgi:transcriptional regulator with XRE-family HTH domain